jgi:putative hydroxymethylpyrimidine transport system permease protein
MSALLRLPLIFLSLLLLWTLIVFIFNLPDFILPYPNKVALTFSSHQSLLLSNLWPTLLETGLGFIMGVCFACIAALVMAHSKLLHHWFFPILVTSQAIPTFAIAPLFIIWFGYGISAKIMITVMMIFFPVTANFYDGLCATPQAWLDLAKIQHATKAQTLWKIKLPAALPRLGSGLRIAAVLAPIGAIVGEWVGASEGLGYLMQIANARLETDLLFACLVLLTLLSLLLYYGVDLIVKRFIFWENK